MPNKLQLGDPKSIELAKLANLIYSGKPVVTARNHDCNCEFCEVEDDEMCPCGGDIILRNGDRRKQCEDCGALSYDDYDLRNFKQLAKELEVEIDWAKVKEIASKDNRP